MTEHLCDTNVVASSDKECLIRASIAVGELLERQSVLHPDPVSKHNFTYFMFVAAVFKIVQSNNINHKRPFVA